MSETNGKKMYRYARMTPEREQKVTELWELVKKNYDPLPKALLRVEKYVPSRPDDPTTKNSSRVYCYAFLQAREWNVQKAFDMMKENIEYRRINRLDERGEFPASTWIRGWDTSDFPKRFDMPQRDPNDELGRLTEATRSFLDFGYHYWDRSGLPTFYMMLGSVKARSGLQKLKKLCKVGETPLDLCWKVLQHIMGVSEALVAFQQQEYEGGRLDVDASEGHIHSYNMVLDMQGLSYKLIWKPAIDLLRGALTRLFKYYPDCVHRIFLVNCPPMIMFGYKLIRPVIPAAAQRKVVIVNPRETFAALSQQIDPLYIPARYKGQCHCEGGCFFGDGAAAGVEETASEGGGVTTENVTVTAGSDYCRVFQLTATETVAWDFAATQCHGVTFTRYFVPTAEAAGMQWSTVSAKKLEPYLICKDHPTSGADTYVSDKEGTLVLMWANRKSWFSSKHLQLRVYKEELVEAA